MTKVLIVICSILLGITEVHGQCINDTISNDIIMMVDNSASIDNAEFESFRNIILSTVNRIAADCPMSRRGVVHYGGAFGQSVTIEHQLSATNLIGSIDRQYCLDAMCENGGDDLNYAMGEIIRMLNTGELIRNPNNSLSIVVFTDASSETSCDDPNCSVTLPTTNVDSLKSTYGANVSIIGISKIARQQDLAISASVGGTYNQVILGSACQTSFEGCTLPRQYIPIEFSDNALTVAAQVATLVSCSVEFISTVDVDAGADQTICADRNEQATLTANPISGQAPYSYIWSNNLGNTRSVTASPLSTSTFTVTIIDGNGCTETDQVTVFVESCPPDCENESQVLIDAGPDQNFCLNLNQSALINTTLVQGQVPVTYQWNENLGTGASKTVRPIVPTTYRITATDANGCIGIDSVTITPQQCNDCFADAGTPLAHKEICLQNGRALITTEDNIGINIPSSFERIFVLTNSELTILDYSIGPRTFTVTSPGIYRIHTLISEVTNRNSPNYFDISVIIKGRSNLFLIANCIVDHNICAAFDFPGRVHVVLEPGDMRCMTFENSINLCGDGIDNDGDGLVDCADPDCKGLIPCLENTLIACNDLIDNDGDGLVDCFDPGCWEFTRCFEQDEDCKDGIDNDGDGLIDCADDSCFGSEECQENSPYTCKDGLDNDRNGLIDCQEPSCQRFIVCSEWGAAACSDGIDNDGDGLIDCADADCRTSFAAACGAQENTAAFCSDGIDNDGDGLVDCEDPDCGVQALTASDINRTITMTPSTCPNNTNGKILIELDQTGWQYSIDGGNRFVASGRFDNLVPGTYNLLLRRQSGCTMDGPAITVTGDTCPEICSNGIDDDGNGQIDCADASCGLVEALAAVITQPLCPQADNGTIRLFYLSGGNTAGIEYSKDGINWQDQPIFRNLVAGNYTIRIRSSKGCSASKSYVLVAPTCTEICDNGIDDDGDGLIDCADGNCRNFSNLRIDINPPSCNTASDGSLTILNGINGYRYSIDGNTFQTGTRFDGLANGNYSIIVRNVAGCDSTLATTLTATAPCPAAIATNSSTGVGMRLRVFLEGPWVTEQGKMHTLLNDQGYLPGQIPTTFFGQATKAGQPYNRAPWYYDGQEGADMIDSHDKLQSSYEETVVDWVLVSLRTDITKASEVYRQCGLLHSDGNIELHSNNMHNTAEDVEYYVMIEHRNHLPIMSAIPLPVVRGQISYDFTTQDSYRPTLGTGQVEHNGVYMMAAGNGEIIESLISDIDINARDLSMWFQSNGFNSSYYQADYDMNGDINVKDRILWAKNNGIFSPLNTK